MSKVYDDTEVTPDDAPAGKTYADNEVTADPPGTVESFVRGAGKVASLGFGPAIEGAYNALRRGTKYTDERDASNKRLSQAEQAHPVITDLGKGTGMGMLAAVPGVQAAAAPLGTMAPVAVGAGFGATQGLGESVSSGAGLKDTAKNVALGTAQGVAMGAAAPALGGVAGRAVEGLQRFAKGRVVAQGISDVAEGSSRLEKRKLAKAIGPVREEMATKEGIAIGDAAHSDPAKARELIIAQRKKLTEDRQGNYATVDRATGGVDPNGLIQHLEAKKAALKGPGLSGERASIDSMIEDIRDNWIKPNESTRPPPAAPAKPKYATELERFSHEDPAGFDYLEPNGKVTATSEQATVAGKNAKPPVAPGETTGMTDANPVQPGRVPTIELRDYVTRVQQEADKTMGALNESKQKARMDMKADLVKEYLNKHLNEAAKVSDGDANTVAKIHEMNKRIVAYGALENALKKKIDDQATAHLGTSKLGMLGHAAEGAMFLTGHHKEAVAMLLIQKLGLPAEHAGSRALARVASDVLGGGTPDMVAKAVSVAIQQGVRPSVVNKVVQAARKEVNGKETE